MKDEGRVEAVAAKKMGKKDEFMINVRVEVGERIPEFAIDKAASLGITPDGRAANGGSCGWTNLIVWQRAWYESESGRVSAPIFG